jgi:hypothetical protein
MGWQIDKKISPYQRISIYTIAFSILALVSSPPISSMKNNPDQGKKDQKIKCTIT